MWNLLQSESKYFWSTEPRLSFKNNEQFLIYLAAFDLLSFIMSFTLFYIMSKIIVQEKSTWDKWMKQRAETNQEWIKCFSAETL